METNHKVFKPFDKVLVKVGHGIPEDPEIWVPHIYAYYDEEYSHSLIDGSHRDDEDILPYEGNEHLVGRVDEPNEEEVKLEEGECVLVFDTMMSFPDGVCAVRKFIKIIDNVFVTNVHNWKYAIRFSDFNPNDMEETKKHILCVKNGKVVKYKE